MVRAGEERCEAIVGKSPPSEPRHWTMRVGASARHKHQHLSSCYAGNSDRKDDPSGGAIGETQKNEASRPMTREPQIKAAVIDALFKHGMVDADTVIVSEMPLASWSRRADLVVANGKLLAFEIKSDADRTHRLAAQIDAYWSAMEGATVITGPRHVESALKSMPAHVGIFVALPGESLRIELARKPHIRPLIAEAAIRLMLAQDLARVLRKQGALGTALDRHSLEKAARALPVSVLRAAALEAVKRRYRSTYQAFLRCREDKPTIEALPLLRKETWRSVSDRRLALRTEAEDEDVGVLPPLKVTPRLLR
jgi:hypothetical protein